MSALSSPVKSSSPSTARPTRSLRKRPAKLADDIDFDLETLLKEHEKSGVEYRAKRDAKKTKTVKDPADEKYADAFKGYEITLDSLPALCIEKIFAMVSWIFSFLLSQLNEKAVQLGFGLSNSRLRAVSPSLMLIRFVKLDSPQDLYNLAFSSKFFMSLVTPEVVIRSAVFNNLRKRDKGNRKIMANIMGYINNRSIHVPSAHRMLRLLNAKSCERGDRCWGKNLNTGKAMSLNRHSFNRPFGLAICEKCVKFGTTKVPYSHFSRFQQGVAFHQWNLLMDPQRDLKTGDVHGPLLEVLELQQIENSYTKNDDKKCALEGVVAKALTNEGKYCPIHYEEKAAAYHEMYENAEKDADEVVVAALERDTIEYIKRREERIAKRMIRIRSIYASLEEILVDCPLKDLALDCTWLEVRRIAFQLWGVNPLPFSHVLLFFAYRI